MTASELLASLGYRIRYRLNGWTECLLASDHESFVGHGEDEAGALADAIRCAFPTHAARAALERWMVAPLAGKLDEAPMAPVSVELDAGPRTTMTDIGPPSFAIATRFPPPMPPDQTVQIPVLRVAQPAVSRAVEHAVETTTPEGGHSVENTIENTIENTVQVPVAAPVVAQAAQPALDDRAEEARVQLERLLEEVEASFGEVARLCPERQRLQILGWICRARALGDVIGFGSTARVAAIAKQLGAMCKHYWPGNVPALKIDARPMDVVRGGDVRTWNEAAAWVQAQLDQMIESARARHEDEDGWRDGDRLRPPPRGADAMLAALAEEIEAFAVEDPDEETIERARKAALRIRWIRKFVKNPEAWGHAIGSLRRFAHQARVEKLSEVLAADYVPTTSWARMLGIEDPNDNKNRDLVGNFAALDKTDKSALEAWVVDAVGSTVDGPQIAALLRAHEGDSSPMLAKIRDGSEDRRVRRRAADIAKRLVAMNANEAARILRESATKEAPPQSVALPEPEEVDDVFARVRPHVEGKRAILVTNRASPDLEAELHAKLGLQVDTIDATPRRVQSACERIANGTYHLVLSATGFQDHAVDEQVARAARTGSVPLIRADRSRPAACARAIARQLGLDRAA